MGFRGSPSKPSRKGKEKGKGEHVSEIDFRPKPEKARDKSKPLKAFPVRGEGRRETRSEVLKNDFRPKAEKG